MFSVYLTVLEDKSDEEQFIDVLNITAAGKNSIKSGTENEGRLLMGRAAPRRRNLLAPPPAPRRKCPPRTTRPPRLKSQPVKFLFSFFQQNAPTHCKGPERSVSTDKGLLHG